MRSSVVWGVWSEHVVVYVVLTWGLAGVLVCSFLLFPCVIRGSADALLLHALEPPPIVEVPVACPGASFPGSLEGELNAMTGDAGPDDAGHLWVAENVLGRSRGDEFSATSPYVCERQLSHVDGSTPTGVAVGHVTGEEQVYVGHRAGYVVVSNGESGATLAEWNAFGGGEVNGVAVDDSPSGPGDWAAGDVLVAANGSQHVVDVLKPKAGGGEEEAAPPLTGTGSGEPFNFLRGIAIDDVNGDVFVVDPPFIDVFEPGAPGEYRFVRKIAAPSGPFGYAHLSVAVDGSEVVEGKEGQLYVGVEGGGVDEFSLTGEFLGGITKAYLQQEQPGGSFEGPVAVDPVSHHVFASVVFDREMPGEKLVVDGFGPNVVIPDVVTEPVSNVVLERGSHLWSARMNGTVNPDDAGVAMCWFLWGTSESFGHETSCDKPVAEGGVPVGVQGELKELQPDTAYYYRLQAKNGHGTDFGEESKAAFTTPGPGLRSESVAEVTSSSVRFEATINPHGKQTFYRFEYDTSPYGQGQAPHGVGVPGSGPVAIGGGGQDVEVEQHVVGLVSGGTYHYRVVAISEVEVEPGVMELVEFDGPDRTFTAQGRGGPFVLPDGRVWELVSPPDKRGAVILPIGEEGLAQTSADGGAFTFVASAATEAQPQGLPEQEQVLSSRCDGVWSSKDIVMPHSEPVGVSIGIGLEYRFFSEDFSSAVAEPLGRFSRPEFEGVYEASPEATERTPYVRHNSICSTSPPTSTPYQPIVSGAPEYEELPPGTKFGGTQEKQGDVRFVGATPDGEHVVVESAVPLTEGGGSLYEWSAGARKPSERLRALYLLPEGEGGNVVGGGGVPSPSSYNHQLSNDGSVFFGSGGHLYLQDVARGVSGRLDVAQGAPEPSGANAGFLYASSDGSRVLFGDSEQLTSAPGGGVYECRVAEVEGRPACAQLVLTGLSGKNGLIGGSRDASYLYFVGNNSDNLYVDHDGAGGWETHSIATLSNDDSPDWAVLAHRTSRVSPNGKWLAFMSDSSLTGYDNRDAKSGVPDEEVYIYNAENGKVACVSCDPTGARPVGRAYELGRLALGNSVWADGRWLAANVPGWTPYKDVVALYQSRYLSDEGRLFFNSSDALVPQDSNGNEDVYEYEPVGVGGCAEGSSSGGSVYKPVRAFELERGRGEEPAGCVSLISSGVGFGESAFLDASETGGDVFFLTAEKLVHKDVDTALDVYDAHECTTPCPVEVSSSPECITPESCRSAPVPQPEVFGAPASATFSGPGNLVPEVVVSSKKVVKKTTVKCRKGFVKNKHGKCGESRKKARRARKASRVTRDRRSGR
jgi:hypothetical protein